MTPLEALAARYAIQTSYWDIGGSAYAAPEATLRALLAAFGVAAETDAEVAASLAAAPSGPPPELRAPEGVACYLPDWLRSGRAWGIAAQLYQLRSDRNWGIGDFADLAALARLAGAEGADFVGVNPLHAPFLADPHQRSPFSPSNRRFLNPLYIAVDALPFFDTSCAPAKAIAIAREGELVDYEAVGSLKVAALRALWRGEKWDRAAFARFRARGGRPLEQHARFETISAHMADEHGAGWLTWPPELQDPASPEVEAFAREHADAVAFHAWLQWLADRQLGEAREAALEAGMRIGLYLDFAVGEAPGGSGTWSDREVAVPDVHVGAPPDYFAVAGQDWRLAPLSPVAMAATGAEPFRTLIEDATRHAGALRIDHVMALWQLFLIPAGATAAEGTYVRFPIAAMLAALAQASHANRTVVIGEDLGNVPEGFRDVLQAAGVLSYRILPFERRADGFIPPQDYPPEALVCLSTHDLPTFEGWWRGDDIGLRARFGLIEPEAVASLEEARAGERRELAAWLEPGAEPDPASRGLVTAVHRQLARAPSRLFAARLEDLAGEVAPVNLPGTVDEYPNWRRRLGVDLEELPGTPLWRDITAALRAERPRATP